MITRRPANVVGLVAVFALAGCHSGQSGPSASDDFTATADAWHAQRVDALTAPDGWLSLVALQWLEAGANRVGRGPAAEVTYEGFPVDHLGTMHVTDGQVRFEQAGEVAVQGVPADGTLHTDADGSPTVLSLGGIRFYVIDRGGRLGVRIKDAAALTRTEFAGIERYPVSESWRITADFDPAGAGAMIGLDTVIGVRVDTRIAGRVRFEHRGHRVDAVLFPSGDGGSMLRFGDATNGDGTYTIGRYLYVEASRDGESVVLDFNRAYNPPCAFTPFATCSIAPPSNQFPFRVDAGERRSD
jgi:uncharacterized protein (DUF1684 family)